MDVLKDILDNLNDSIVIIDPAGNVVLCNKEALYLQKSISQKPILIGGAFLDTVDEGHREDISGMFKTVKRQLKAHKVFAEFDSPAGARIFLEIKWVPVLRNNRELLYVSIISQDITARKMLESRARADASDIRNLMEQANAIIFSVDSRGYIVEWNNHCSEITGFHKGEVYGKKLADMLAECDDQLVDNLMEDALKACDYLRYELPFRCKDGKSIQVIASITPRKNALGQVVGATLVGQDIVEIAGGRSNKVIHDRTAPGGSPAVKSLVVPVSFPAAKII